MVTPYYEGKKAPTPPLRSELWSRAAAGRFLVAHIIFNLLIPKPEHLEEKLKHKESKQTQ